MNRTLKYILLSVCGCLLAICIISSYIAGERLGRTRICERIEIRVLDSLENNFISQEDIIKVLDKTYGKYLGVTSDSLDLTGIEEIVNRKSAVLKSEAYVTADGTLHIDIIQRKPVVRFQKQDGGFYADVDGCIFPLQSSFASHVQVIDGHIPIAANSGYKGEITDASEKKWFDSMMNLVNFLENDSRWKGKIVQIHVREDSDLVLVPRTGRERFIIGQPEELEDKFGRMEKYYTAILPEKGSDRYKEVDLRFKGQIICR